MLVGDQPVGTWLLAFRGAAVRVLSTDEARQTNGALDALEAALAGDGDIDAYFADLVDREPVLPEHLQRSSDDDSHAARPGAGAVAYPLIAQLFWKHGFAEVHAGHFAALTGRPGRTCWCSSRIPSASRKRSISR